MLRVDTMPWYARPFFLIYGYGMGIILYCFVKLISATCRITLCGAPMPEEPVIYCIWHKDLVLYFSVFNKVKKQVWMNHPAWYMKPVHVLLRLTGVEHICLGSSGNSGKQALGNVIGYLQKGYSTTIASDGPAGPAQVLKPGVLWMSRDGNIPVVALRCFGSRGFRLGGWDRKFVPFLFSEINVDVSERIFVNEDNIGAAAGLLAQHLDKGSF